jgi:ligand-binding sensor protein/AraC-like DNA-binding protein
MAELQVSSLVDLDHLQRVQQRFAEATDLAIIAVNSRGTPVTAACRFSEFCQRMRADPVRRQLCYGCDAHGGLQAAIKKRPHIYQCHAGLVDFSIPITAGDVYIGAVLCGQVRVEQKTDALDFVMTADDSWQHDRDLRELRDQNRPSTLRQVEAAAETLWDVLKDIDDTTSRTISLPPVAAASVTAVTAPPDDEAVPPGLFWGECDAEDLPAAFARLDAVLDTIWELPPAARAIEVERVEDAIADVARALCPDMVNHLRYLVLKHRAKRPPAPNRFQAQTVLETMLVVVFDAIRRLRPKRHRDFQDLLNAIEKRRARTFSLKEAAGFLSISPGHLSKKFKATTGQSFISYVMERRLRRAYLMLAHTDLPVVKVASELGFNQANYFARVFKAETGLSPSEYRREAANPGSRHAAVSCRD